MKNKNLFIHRLTIILFAILSTSMTNAALNVTITKSPYNAMDNGATNNRRAIQNAINDVSAAGGGTVNIPSGLFKTGNLILKSSVTINFTTSASVLQQSQTAEDYDYTPLRGHEINNGIKWNITMFTNYPFIYAGSGSTNVGITGPGKILMTYNGNPATTIEVAPIGFFDVSTYTIAGIKIEQARTFSICLFKTSNGTVRNVTIASYIGFWNTDGISLQNSHNVRITGSTITTYDDGLYIWASYQDPRKSLWWNSDNPQASLNIEIDNNVINGNGANVFALIPWGKGATTSSVLMSGINIHDNTFNSINGMHNVWCWCDNPYRGQSPFTGNEMDPSSMGTVIFKNNNFNGNVVDLSMALNTITDLQKDFFFNPGFEESSYPLNTLKQWNYTGVINKSVGGSINKRLDRKVIGMDICRVKIMLPYISV